MTTYYKVTGEKGEAFHGGSGSWPLPSGKRPGKLLRVEGKIVACSRGLHFCSPDQLVTWLGPVIWEFEPRGEILNAGDKMVCAEGRLVRRCPGWNEMTARLFAVDCATRALNREKKAGRTPDPRSYAVLKVARRFAKGEASYDELSAARSAAWSAAESAAWSAMAAARSAAESAAWSAMAAARSAAWSAAGSAAESARSAAESAEKKWQTKRLMEYINGERWW